MMPHNLLETAETKGAEQGDYEYNLLYLPHTVLVLMAQYLQHCHLNIFGGVTKCHKTQVIPVICRARHIDTVTTLLIIVTIVTQTYTKDI